MNATEQEFEHSLALPFFGIGVKTDLSCPVATAEFPKFAGILSAALSWHYFIYNSIYLLGEGKGTPLQYSCLENPMDGGAWWATVHGVAKSQR